jgi:hypothetical protein
LAEAVLDSDFFSELLAPSLLDESLLELDEDFSLSAFSRARLRVP